MKRIISLLLAIMLLAACAPAPAEPAPQDDTPLPPASSSKFTREELEQKLTLPASGKLKVVLDTDAYNEVDDQFAIAYMLLASHRFDVQAIYAAPFLNSRVKTAREGMEASYDEILEILKLMDIDHEGFVFKGSEKFLGKLSEPLQSAAADDLIERALESKETLYVVAIGACTNVVSAILKEPDIIDKIVVVWLGGHALNQKSTDEFNLRQDLMASQYLFECGVPLIQVPCNGVTSHMYVSVEALKKDIGGTSKLADLLVGRVEDYRANHFGYEKQLWDVGAVGYLMNPSWMTTEFVTSPRISSDLKWRLEGNSHIILTGLWINRNAIIYDLCMRLKAFKDPA